jgi:hypothetical protein
MRGKARTTLVLAIALQGILAATPATAAPKRPTSLRATAITTTGIRLAWRDRARNETRYELRAGSRRIRLPRNAHGATVTGLLPDTGYAFRVRACRRSSCSAFTKPLARITRDPRGVRPPVVGGCRVFPASSPWNRDVRADPVDRYSAQYIAASLAGHRVHLDFGSTEQFYGFPWTLVPAGVPTSTARITYGTDGADYGDESDHGPMPIPLGAPIEGWDGPGHDPDGGDRHVLALQQGSCKLYELYNAVRTPSGFRVSSSAVFDLTKTTLRPAGWTSADAAGLPIFPGLLRYDEAATAEIRHAIRFTVQRAQRAYVAPARHLGTQENPACLPYGARLRLRASFPEAPYHGPALAIIRALKRYGMIFADQGSAVYLSGTSDPRWDPVISAINSAHPIRGEDFEVVRLPPISRDWKPSGAPAGAC